MRMRDHVGYLLAFSGSGVKPCASYAAARPSSVLPLRASAPVRGDSAVQAGAPRRLVPAGERPASAAAAASTRRRERTRRAPSVRRKHGAYWQHYHS